jgi:hypothetical protein
MDERVVTGEGRYNHRTGKALDSKVARKGRRFARRTPKRRIIAQHERVLLKLQVLRDNVRTVHKLLELAAVGLDESLTASLGGNGDAD